MKSFLFLVLFIFIPQTNGQCFDYDSNLNRCHLCQNQYFQNSSFFWTGFSDFPSDECLLKETIPIFQEIFVSSDATSENSSIGNLSFPFSSLFLGFKFIIAEFSSYYFSNITLYLMGNSSHYLYNMTPEDSDYFFLFRRMNINLTITPLFCSYQNVSGCLDSIFSKSEIILQQENIYFFISNQMTFINIIFNGIDMHLDSLLSNDAKNSLFQTTVCSLNDLDFLETDNITKNCFLENKTILQTQFQILYGFFNLESFVECQTCSPPVLIIINCEFQIFNSLMINYGYLSLIYILKGIPSNIQIINTVFSQVFFIQGIISVNSYVDIYYKYVSSASLGNSIEQYTLLFKDLEINFENSIAKYYNSYNIFVNKTSISIFSFDNSINYGYFSLLPALRFSSDTNVFLMNNCDLFKKNFSFLKIYDFDQTSFLLFTKTSFQSNNFYSFLVVLSKISTILIEDTNFLDNINFENSFASFNTITLQNSVISNLTLMQNSFFYLNNSILSIYDSVICLIISPKISSFIGVSTIMLSYMSIFVNTPIFLNVTCDSIFLKNTSFSGTTNINLLSGSATQIISSVYLINCSFTSFRMDVSQSFLYIMIEKEITVNSTTFENIYGNYIFDLTYSRNRTFQDFVLKNSNISFFTGKFSGRIHAEFFYIFTMVIENITMNNPASFFQLESSYEGLSMDIVILNSKMSNIILQNSLSNLMDFVGAGMYMLIRNFTIEEISFLLILYYQGYAQSDNMNFIANISNFNVISKNVNFFLDFQNVPFILLENSSFICENPTTLFQDNDIAIISTCFPQCYLIIKNCTFQNLRGAFSGGGLSLDYQNSKRILIIDCLFESNGNELYSTFADIQYTFVEDISLEGMKDSRTEILDNYNLFCYDLQNTTVFAEENECLSFTANSNVILNIFDQFDFFFLSQWNNLIRTHGIHNSTFSNSFATSILLNENSELVLYNVTFQNLFSVYWPSVSKVISLSFWYSYNVTFKNCSSGSNGGGFYIGSLAFFDQNIFINIFTTQEGGVFDVEQGGRLIITNSEFFNVKATTGGFCVAFSGSVNLTNVAIKNVSADLIGGSIYIDSAVLYMTFCDISNSSSGNDGAVIYLNKATFIKISESNFTNCISNGKGIIYILGFSEYNLYFVKLRCTNNSAKFGSCVYMRDGNAFFNSSTFQDNLATNYVIYGYSSFSEVSIYMYQCNFSNNQVPQILFFQQASIYIFNLSIYQENFSNVALVAQFCSVIIDGALFNFSNSQYLVNQQTYIASFIYSSGKFQNCFYDAQGSANLGCLSCENSNFEMISLKFNNCEGINGGAIEIFSNSAVNISYSNFFNNSASYGAGIYISNSYLISKSNAFLNNKANDGSDIFISNELILEGGYLEILNSNFSDFSLLSTSIKQSAMISLIGLLYNQSVVNIKTSDIPNYEAVGLENVLQTTILNSCFYNIQGQSSIRTINTGLSISIILIGSSSIYNCSSINDGGALYLMGNYNLTLLNSRFTSNHADGNGGVIFSICQTSNCFIYQIENNTFINNSADFYGGVIKMPFLLNPILSKNVFVKNFAEIGSIIATNVVQIFIISTSSNLDLNSTKILNFNNSLLSMNVSSGQSILLTLLMADSFDNFLMFENSGEITIETVIDPMELKINQAKFENFKLLNNRKNIQSGIVSFNSLTLIGQPGNIYFASIVYQNQYDNFSVLFQFNLNLCKTGEIYINSECLPCEIGFYSLEENSYQTSKSTCDICPDNAKCPGGLYIIPNPGYWRFNQKSTIVVQCFSDSGCPNQTDYFDKNPANYTYQCEYGSYGNLCSNCISGFTKTSDESCTNCSTDTLIYVKFFGLFFLSILFLTYQSIVALNPTDSSVKKKLCLKF